MQRDKMADLVLRAGLAFAFLYPPLSALVDPSAWIGYFPSFMRGILPDLVLLHVFGLAEVIIALWILSGRNIFWPCALAALMLCAIVLFDPAEFQVVFRDLSIASIAVALAVSHYTNRFGRLSSASS